MFSSTIHGRIDQVNQLLELDYQKRGGVRYTALDKWTNQLNSLNQAIVSKLTWFICSSKKKKKTEKNFNKEWHVLMRLSMKHWMQLDGLRGAAHKFCELLLRVPQARWLVFSQGYVHFVLPKSDLCTCRSWWCTQYFKGCTKLSVCINSLCVSYSTCGTCSTKNTLNATCLNIWWQF